MAILFLILSTSVTYAQIVLSRPLIEKWRHQAVGTTNLTPTVSKESIYLTLSSGTLYSLDASDGNLNWSAEIGGIFSAAPTSDEQGVYIASETKGIESSIQRTIGTLRAIGSRSGVTLWMRMLPSPIYGALVSNDTTLFGGTKDGRLYAVRKQTGELLWAKQYHLAFSGHPVLFNNHLFIGDESGNLLIVETLTGNTFWRYQTEGDIRAVAVLPDEKIFIGTGEGFIYALDAGQHLLRWKVRTGGGVQSIVPTASGLIVNSLDNFVYNLSYRRGKKLWKRQLAGRATARPLLVGDCILITPLAGDESVVLDVRDGKKLNSIPTGEDENTDASPLLAGHLLLLTTRKGLVAYTDTLSAIP
ncbi:MAG: PQQ-binding-like beta-propeller repeat protein [Pyrinomonadaceae bacterium]